MNRRYNRFGLVRANHALHERGAFVLTQRILKGVRPDGDGWEEVWEESRWNDGKKNPLELTYKCIVARKQAAARMVRAIESRDDRRVYLIDTETEMYFDLGRNEGEVKPNSSVQGFRQTDLERGGIYSGGLKAMREALKKRQQYDEQPVQKKSAEAVRLEKIEELENRIKELMGLLK